MSDVVRLEYRNVTMCFMATSGKGLTAVAEVSFAVRDGEVVALIGPSGCGKSTLLNIGSGLYTPSEGEAVLGGRCADADGAAAGTGAEPQARGQNCAADHARSSRSRHAVGPRAGDEPPPGTHRRRDPRRVAAARRPDRTPGGTAGQ